MQEKHKSVDDFAASNKTSSLCHKKIQPELTCETESHTTKMSLKLMKANTEAKLHHSNLFSKLSLSLSLSLSIAHIKKNASISLSP
jgi:hypothetical protein